MFKKLKEFIIGPPRDIKDTTLFHKLSLIPILAWIGLGADGLSSSSYGPEEAYRLIGSHSYLAIFLGLATAITVFIISYAYSRIIEHFPHGGGGYVVATHTIGESAGVLSGAALLVDYVLTIAVSLASCGDAIFSYLPLKYHGYKIFFVSILIIFLIIINMRGVRESITILTPIFIVFAITHAILIGYGISIHTKDILHLTGRIELAFKNDITTIGWTGILALFLKAFSMGAGTYTGIEAVSNGMQIMREPKVKTGKKTMAYMATSLAITAGGLLFCYYLFEVRPIEGKTLNTIIAEVVFKSWPKGDYIAFITILSEGILLIVAAQTGFIDGPRVMANMAIDSWLPRRFSSLSERLTMQNGILIIGISSILLLFYTGGSVSALIVMYSINVFITFSISQLGMVLFFLKNKEKDRSWKRHLIVHIIGFVLCVTILSITIYEKFLEGGWITILITGVLIYICYMIKRHYVKVRYAISHLEQTITDMPTTLPYSNEPIKKADMTAIILVNGFNGFGIHTLLSVVRYFPNVFKNYIFLSIAVVDSGMFKGISELNALVETRKKELMKYVTITRRHGFPAEYRVAMGTDVVEEAIKLVKETVMEFPKSMVFTGKLVFKKEHLFHKILHNETAYAIQRHLQWEGIPTTILPIRIHIENAITS